MIIGEDIFRGAFSKFSGNYVVIGGVACYHYEEDAGQEPRATRDFDMILIVEVLSHDFVKRFWQFIKDAGYSDNNMGEKGEATKHQHFRFNKPSKAGYPSQIELFSRTLDIMDVPADLHVTPIPTDADLSSLSAILLDNNYYNYTLAHSSDYKGIHLANIESLIVLKCKAYLELTKAKEAGEAIDSNKITKHKNDVFRLVGALPSAEATFAIPPSIFDDVRRFCSIVEPPELNLLKKMRIRGITGLDILNRLKLLFTEDGGRS